MYEALQEIGKEVGHLKLAAMDFVIDDIERAYATDLYYC